MRRGIKTVLHNPCKLGEGFTVGAFTQVSSKTYSVSYSVGVVSFSGIRTGRKGPPRPPRAQRAGKKFRTWLRTAGGEHRGTSQGGVESGGKACSIEGSGRPWARVAWQQLKELEVCVQVRIPGKSEKILNNFVMHYRKMS